MVDYTGYLLAGGVVFDSSVFESSEVRGHSPISVTVGAGGVIPGFDEGLSGIKVGESRTLIIPAAIGYGSDGNPPTIPGDATLVFTVTRRRPPTIGLFGTNQIGFGGQSPPPTMAHSWARSRSAPPSTSSPPPIRFTRSIPLTSAI